MTPAEREKVFRRARLDVLKLRTQILRGTAGEITQLLKVALADIQVLLATQPTDYERWYLPQLKRGIELTMDTFERGAVSSVGSGMTQGWSAGQRLVDAPIEAGGVRIAAVLPGIDTRQLTAMRSFMVDRIGDISKTVASRIGGQLGLVTIGAQSPSDAIGAIADMIDGGRTRAMTIVRTEVGRAFSVAADERMSQAAEILPGMKKQWRRSGKIHSRFHHDSIDGQIVAQDEPFTLGNGVKIMFPRDPAAPAAETINCGCESLPYMEEWTVENPGKVPFSDRELQQSETKRWLAEGGSEAA